MQRTTALAALSFTLVLSCRSRSDLGEDHASLAGARDMARSFWLEVLAGNHDAAQAYLATDEEIEAALRGWSRVMNEPVDDQTLARQVEDTSSDLHARWNEIRSGTDPVPEGLDAEGINKADTIVGNKMFIGPGVSYIQRLSLTGPGVDPVGARVAGAVRVGDGGWKIIWLP